MKNEHIELVKKWLAGESVSRAELVANAADAYAAADDASDAAADASDAADAADAVACGARAAVHARYDSASHWVKEYEKLRNTRSWIIL
tara:strand:- start:22 stop:288 length:267 start_codon:yes stop_codon:yes gene_type:complete